MKSLTFLLTTVIGLFGFSQIIKASQPDSAYANASLFLTSTNSQQTATANSTVPVGYANALAVPGTLTNWFQTSAVSGGASTAYQNETVSGFTDTLTINSPGLTGSAGTLDFNFFVSGTFSLTSASPAVSELIASATFNSPGASQGFSYTKDSNGNTTGVNFLNTTETISVPFVFGTPFTIDFSLDFAGLVSGLTGGSAAVSGSFTTAASTDNIKSSVALLPSGHFTEKAASGANYLSQGAASPLSIPEPGLLALVAAGLGFLPLARRFRRK